jgi:hypothetical protein
VLPRRVRHGVTHGDDGARRRVPQQQRAAQREHEQGRAGRDTVPGRAEHDAVAGDEGEQRGVDAAGDAEPGRPAHMQEGADRRGGTTGRAPVRRHHRQVGRRGTGSGRERGGGAHDSLA